MNSTVHPTSTNTTTTDTMNNTTGMPINHYHDQSIDAYALCDLPEISDITTRGSIDTMTAYLGSAQITAEEFVKFKPEVPIGLLNALGLAANTVPLNNEDPVSYLLNAMRDTNMNKIHDQHIENVIASSESTIDLSQPMSQYAVNHLRLSNVMSMENKHACVAAMNSIWTYSRDNSLVISSDISKYADDESTAPSAEFTGGAGSIAMITRERDRGKLLDILDVVGVSARLTYDFFKPSTIKGTKFESSIAPVVYGKYSNLANIEQVTKAYLNLKEKVNISLDQFAGIVLHTPYPGITKYNIAALSLVDRAYFECQSEVIRNGFENGNGNGSSIKYGTLKKQAHDDLAEILYLIENAHTHFAKSQFDAISAIEKSVKKILKTELKTEQCKKHLEKNRPSLKFISQVGNIYTGSSPLCMMSLLENNSFDKDEYILWGGYGSGNQAIFMIARTKNETSNIAKNWQTQKNLDARIELTAEQYASIKDQESNDELVMEALAEPIFVKSRTNDLRINEYEIRGTKDPYRSRIKEQTHLDTEDGIEQTITQTVQAISAD